MTIEACALMKAEWKKKRKMKVHKCGGNLRIVCLTQFPLLQPS